MNSFAAASISGSSRDFIGWIWPEIFNHSAPCHCWMYVWLWPLWSLQVIRIGSVNPSSSNLFQPLRGDIEIFEVPGERPRR